MIAFRFVSYWGNVQRAIDRGRKRVFAIMGFRVFKTARGKILKRRGPSEPGKPPHTHANKYLYRAIIYSAGTDDAVIGARFSAVGVSQEVHEKGGKYKKGTYPKRPFMVPSLDENLKPFASQWEGAIG
jgi:phage gpG-like protein